MFQRYEKTGSRLFYLLLMIEIVIVTILGLKQHENVSFINEPIYTLNNGWTYVDDDGNTHNIDLPIVLNAGEDHTIVISHKLPTNNLYLTNFSILTSHQKIEAYIDGRLIYTKADGPNFGLFDVPSGSIWNIIKIPPYSEGKHITIKITSKYEEYAGKINEMHIGTKAALIIHNINASGLSLIISFITLSNGIIMILIYCFLKRLIAINRSILFLGWFSLLSSIWMIMESNLTQLFLDNEFVISTLTYLTVMTFPIPFLLYISLMENIHYRKLIHWLIFTFLSSAFTLILLQLLNIWDFHESLLIIRFETIIIFSLVILILLLEIFRYKNREMRAFTVSTGMLFIFGMIEIISYYSNIDEHTGGYFQLGFLLFTVILSWDKLKSIAEVIKLSESAKHYKLLATRDFLTNCRNRVSYARDMDRISPDRKITIFVADMNNMKQINDTYGHHAGDEAIILCSQCLLKVFGRRVYRIGGDEFVCIAYDLNSENADAMLTEFITECEKANEDATYAFYMSIGYAIFDKNIDKSVYDTVNRADKDMYDRKNMMKQ